ncbi:hypothetical protein F53441_1840 [Fusarium austroafricanum]|uniref:Uncharacterized protein n=1 Tax=Fusarium austroafricanum TaxID=2364996 RepID=A0A8H4KUE2_9HYPO|nr:hypothetical protein F53441_1840 [Fusarium austroafricanum]
MRSRAYGGCWTYQNSPYEPEEIDNFISMVDGAELGKNGEGVARYGPFSAFLANGDLSRINGHVVESQESSSTVTATVTDLSEPYFDMLRLPDGPNQQFNPSKMPPTASGAPTNPGIPRTGSFSPWYVTTGQSSINMRSQSPSEWDVPSVSRTLFANTGDFDSTQEVQLPEGLSSQFSTFVPMSRSSTSSVLPNTNPLPQGDADFFWDSNTYSLPMRPMGGFSGSPNMDNMFIGGEGADFDVHAASARIKYFLPESIPDTLTSSEAHGSKMGIEDSSDVYYILRMR